jgi:hypothetical protein
LKNDLLRLLPENKHDTAKAAALVALGFPQVEPVLPQILEWLQDMNWPVARVLEPLVADIGLTLAPHIRTILETGDDIWKYHSLQAIRQSSELIEVLRPELERLSSGISSEPDLPILALEILRDLD